MSVVWINGKLDDDASARVSPFDHGLVTGDGVFETLRVSAGGIFAPRRHLERLARSAAGMGLQLPEAAELREALDDVVEANGLAGKDGRLRITVTGGVAALGSERADVEPTVIIAAGPLPARPAFADVTLAPWPRNERGALAGLKTISYAENVRALTWARERGADEAIFANLAGNLCEGTGTNIFVALGGRLLTPPLSAGCLAGVTRSLLLELGPAIEEDVDASELGAATEAFLTSTLRDVQAIRNVDGRPLGACPGPLTTEISARFAELRLRDLDP